MATKKKDLKFICNPRNESEKAGWLCIDGKDYAFPLNQVTEGIQGDGRYYKINENPYLVQALIDSEYCKTLKFSTDGNPISFTEALEIAKAK